MDSEELRASSRSVSMHREVRVRAMRKSPIANLSHDIDAYRRDIEVSRASCATHLQAFKLGVEPSACRVQVWQWTNPQPAEAHSVP